MQAQLVLSVKLLSLATVYGSWPGVIKADQIPSPGMASH